MGKRNESILRKTLQEFAHLRVFSLISGNTLRRMGNFFSEIIKFGATPIPRQ
jgi:hypothetical protein